MSKNAFLSLGEHPILDFCNTLICHQDAVEDRLHGAKEAENFVSEFFSLKTKIDPRSFNSLIKLRSLLRNYFYYRLGIYTIDPTHDLNSWFSEHPLVLSFSGHHAPKFTTLKGEHFFAAITSSLNSFLNDLDQKRLKKCANPNCSHLFYDISKNNKRQWCSMSSCGNVMKARAFYARRKRDYKQR